MIDRMCSPESKGDKIAAFTEKRAARLATMLQLNDAQKASLKDLEDTRAKSRADFKASICAKKRLSRPSRTASPSASK